MKLVRYGNPGKEKPGLIDAEGKLRSLAGLCRPDCGQDCDRERKEPHRGGLSAHS